jgi:hypothetical protein
MADCSGRAKQVELVDNSFDDLVLTPNVYYKTTSMALNDGETLTLDADGDSNAVWIFNLAGGVTFSGTVLLINYPGSDVPVWWNVGGGLSDVTYISSGAVIKGQIMSTLEIKVYDTTSTSSLLTLNSVTINGGTTVSSQARTYPNPYAAVTGG